MTPADVLGIYILFAVVLGVLSVLYASLEAEAKAFLYGLGLALFWPLAVVCLVVVVLIMFIRLMCGFVAAAIKGDLC